MKILSKKFFIYFFVTAFVLASFIFLPLLGTDIFRSGAFMSTPEPTNVAKVDEIWNGKAFNLNNLNTLLKYVSNDDAISTGDMYLLEGRVTQTVGVTAEDMRNSTAGGKVSGQDIVVRFGGLDWTPVFVSKNKSSELILTLWLTNNEQDAWQDRTGKETEGAYYGFMRSTTSNKIGLYSDFSGDWYNTAEANGVTEFQPNNMYGSSYISVKTLNNGGYYATGNYGLSIEQNKDPNNVFAKFTMLDAEESVASYIETPNQMIWQEMQEATAYNPNISYKLANDELVPVASDPGYNTDTHNYRESDYYTQWGEANLWLPSVTEVGFNGSNIGMWKTSTMQRNIFNGNDNQFTTSSNIGSANSNYPTTAYTVTWLRSANAADTWQVYALQGGGNANTLMGCYASAAVRPALHLNLTKATHVAPLADTVASAPGEEGYDDISQEPGANANEVVFRIKTAEGFLKLSEYTEIGGLFNSKWKFYLENDIDISAVCNNFTPIGGKSNPFICAFDGQHHTLTFAQKDFGDNDEHPNLVGALFGTIGSIVIQNLNLNIDVVMTSNETFLGVGSAVALEAVEGSTIRFTHIHVNGNMDVYTVDFYSECILLYEINNSVIKAYDIQSSIEGATLISFLKNTQIDLDYARASVVAGAIRGGSVLNIRRLYACYLTYSADSDIANIKCTECMFISNGDDEFIGYTGCYGPMTTATQNLSIELTDCAIYCDSVEKIDMVEFLQNTDITINVKASGVYTASNKGLSEYAPNFTSSRWICRADINGGLPTLSWTLWQTE